MLRRFLLALGLSVWSSAGFAQAATEAEAANLRLLDRTSGVLEDIVLQRNSAVKVGSLNIMLRACRYPRRAINTDAYAFLEVYDTAIDEEIFNGWMIASSPGLNAMEHSRYDVWVLRCKRL